MSLVNHRFQAPSTHDHPTRCRLAASFLSQRATATKKVNESTRTKRLVVVRGCQEEKRNSRRTFLSPEEAGLVEMSGLSTHERFLCRLTISSLNLLRVIAEQEGVPVEKLNAGQLCDWFLRDKLKREQNVDSAVLQWDDSDIQI